MLKTYTIKSEELVKVGNITVAKQTVVDQFGTERLVHVDIKPQVAVIFAITPENKVVCIRQYRFGPKKIMTELPGGKVDQSEDIVQAGKRELLEETGYSGDFELVASSFATPNSTSIRHTLICKNATQIQEPAPMEDESIEITLISLDEFKSMLKLGEIFPTEAGYLGLDYLCLL